MSALTDLVAHADAELATLRDAGLVPLQLTGLQYNPLNQRYTLGPDTDVNYLIACQRC